MGHNGGPPLDEHVPEWGVGGIGTYFAWRAASEAAFKKVPVETAIRRAQERPRSSASPIASTSSKSSSAGAFLQKDDMERIAADHRQAFTALRAAS